MLWGTFVSVRGGLICFHAPHLSRLLAKSSALMFYIVLHWRVLVDAMPPVCLPIKNLSNVFFKLNYRFQVYSPQNANGVVLLAPGHQLPQYWPTSAGPRYNIKMLSYQYRKSHCGDKTVVRSSYLHNGISYTGKSRSLYWIRALITPPVAHFTK